MFKEDLARSASEHIHPRGGACGMCHAVAEEVCRLGGRVVAYEKERGILARILDDKGKVLGDGFGIVWSHAVLAAEIEEGIIPEKIAEVLRKEGINSKEDIERVADLYGYGRVLTPAAMALMAVRDLGGRTLVRRKGLGVEARFVDSQGNLITASPPSYCPTSAVTVAAARTPEVAAAIKERLVGAQNTGKKKFNLGIENRYEIHGGHVKVTLSRGGEILARRVRGCCMAYGTAKVEVVAGLVPKASSELFKNYCNLCPFKHCWMEKSMGATGNLVLQRLGEIGTEIEITAEGGIMARIPGHEGEVIQGRGTLCSLSALTNLLLRNDAEKVLRPSSTRGWEEK